MAEISLGHGRVALVDDEDLPLVSGRAWYAHKRGRRRYGEPRAYVACSARRNGSVVTLSLHREILGVTDPAVQVDHTDGNPLNNQRCNLRLASKPQNLGNSRKRGGPAASPYKGVTTRANGKFQAVIGGAAARQYLGTFDSEVAAATAYDAAARLRFGEFARLNFPRDGEQPALERAP